jgi:Anti-sigma-K factor rskA
MIDDRQLLRHLEDGGDDLFARAEPPALDLDAITAQAAPAPRVSARRTVRVRPLMALGGAVACVGIGLLGGAILFGGADSPARPEQQRAAAPAPPTTPRGRQVELARFDPSAPAEAAAEASVFTATDGRTVELRLRGLPAPKKGEFYELWILGGGKKMISLGVVRVNADGAADVRMPLPVSLRRFPVFDLSLEPGDGNPAHSGHSILRSAAAA